MEPANFKSRALRQCYTANKFTFGSQSTIYTSVCLGVPWCRRNEPRTKATDTTGIPIQIGLPTGTATTLDLPRFRIDNFEHRCRVKSEFMPQRSSETIRELLKNQTTKRKPSCTFFYNYTTDPRRFPVFLLSLA